MCRAQRRRTGNRHPNFAPQGVYRSRGDDAWVAISVRDDSDWRALGDVLGNPAWHGRTEFTAADGRRAGHDEIDDGIEAWTSQRDAVVIETELQAAGVPAAAVLDYKQLGGDPQLAARGAFQRVEHPAFGMEVRATSQWHRGRDPQQIDLPAPRFGEHNERVLRDIIGMPGEEIAALQREGVIGDEIRAGVD
jgi:crotonobetainyl-CoA:carnitine CoA-transferase CaiB-like acyl-CoA transferase